MLGQVLVNRCSFQTKEFYFESQLPKIQRVIDRNLLEPPPRIRETDREKVQSIFKEIDPGVNFIDVQI